MQSRTASLIETTAGLVVGFIVAMVVGHFVYRAFGHQVSLGENFWMTVIFTVVSFIRSYLVRRGFNYLHVKGILK